MPAISDEAMALDLTKPLSWTRSLAGNTRDARDEFAMLGDLQGNILKGHGRRFTSHVFLAFRDAPGSRHFVADVCGSLTTALEQLVSARSHKAGSQDEGGFHGFLLSSAGYRALGLGDLGPQCKAFTDGMKARASPAG